ncbi:MAG TPA: ATP-binding protein, partial [Candidatus Didemnitutus sp.]|nr:ATP-binding protein [Candidatus Didemnitutus sp.]
ITDRKRAEEAQHNLAHASRLAIVGELTASIAHEINQPLGAILSNTDAAEMLLERPVPPLEEVRKILADIRKDDMRAGDIIAHLRALLRKRELEFHALNLNDVVLEVVRLTSPDIQRRRIKLDLQLAPDLPSIQGDRVHLQQVLLNLVVNAMDALQGLPSTARLHLNVSSSTTPQGEVEIVVSDTGHGIPPDRLSRIFDSFFTTKKDGMGLGLSMARSLIEIHHGTIVASNNPNGGATFRFKLPPRTP